MARVMEIADRKEEAADTPVVEITTVAANRVAAITADGGKQATGNWLKGLAARLPVLSL